MPYDIGKLKYWQGKHLSYAHRLKIKLADKRNRKQRSIVMKQLFAEGKLKAPWKGKKLPLYIRKKISETKKKQCSTKEHREKTSRFFKRYWREHPIKLKKMLNKTVYLWKKNPKLREKINKKISLRGRMRFKNPLERIRMRRAVKEYWKEHPGLDEKWSRMFETYYMLNATARKKLLEHNKNPFRKRIKTKSGYLVRSKGEKLIADKLSEKKIVFDYEKQPLLFKEDSCIPDFWLPREKIIIEYYGGHPKSWKKKVIKNKLYKKYNIPVISITPFELINLDYYLIKEIKKLNKSKISTQFNIKKFQNSFIMLYKDEKKLMIKLFPQLLK